jgi:hypothetical protein
MLAELPDAPPDVVDAVFGEAELHRLFLHVMPNEWQEKFEGASETAHNSTKRLLCHNAIDDSTTTMSATNRTR